MQVYIHIGRPKTGTTALQKYLFAHRDELLQQGWLYPESGMFDGAHHQLALALNNNIPADLSHIPHSDLDTLVHGLDVEIDRHQPNRLILSSEFFSLLTPDIQRSGRERLAALFDGHDVKIITYFRNQCDYLESSYSQEVKNGRMKKPVAYEAFEMACLRRKGLNYLWATNQWSEVFGKDSIIVRPFEKSQLKDKDIIADFAAIAGFSLVSDAIAPRRTVNVGLTCQRIDLMNRLAALPFTDFERELLFDTISSLPPLVSEEAGYTFLGEQVRQQLIRDYSDSNAVLAREFLGQDDGILFRDTQRSCEVYQGFPGGFLEAAVRSLMTDSQCRGILSGMAQRHDVTGSKLLEVVREVEGEIVEPGLLERLLFSIKTVVANLYLKYVKR